MQMLNRITKAFAGRERPSRRTALQNAGIALALFLVFMTFYCFRLNYPIFSDEGEVFEKGYLISRGTILYKDTISQHMPFSYYMATVIAWFGPVTAVQYRFGFYIMISLLYIAIFFRNRRHISPLVLVMAPLFYLIQLPHHSYGFAMLSDHWQGIGIGIILLELLRYLKEKKITVAMSVWISLAIQLSFGCAFLAAYAILPLILAVAAIQLHDYLKTPKEERKAFRKRLLREDGLLVGIVLLPMAIILVWYAINGSLSYFIEGAYTLNRDVYPRYLGGYGNSALGAVGTTVDYFVATYKDVIRSLIQPDFSSPEKIGLFLMLVSHIAVAGYLAVKKHFAAAIGWLAACFFCGVRGFDGFHGMPYLFVGSLAFALVFSWCMKRMITEKKYVAGIAAVTALVFAAQWVPENLEGVPSNLKMLKSGSNETKALMDTILDPDDRIHGTSIEQMTLCIDLQRLQDYSAAISTPWTYEVYGETELKVLQENRTKVVFYTPGYVLWGRNADEYGAAVANYIQENYTLYGSGNVWILNDYWEEAMDRIDMPEYRISQRVGNASATGKTMQGGESFSQILTAEKDGCAGVLLMTKCDEYRNPAGLTLEIIDCESGETVGTGAAGRTEILDSGWTPILAEADLKAGKQYEFRFTAEECEGETHIAPMMTDLSGGNETTYAVIGGDPQEISLAMKVIGKLTGAKHPLVAMSNGSATDFVNIGITQECIQYFTAERNMTLEGVSLQIGKYADTANGVIAVEVRDCEAGTAMAETTADTGPFGDSLFSDVLFDQPVQLERGHDYAVVISMADDTKGAPAMGMAKEDETKERDLSYGYYGTEDTSWDYCMYLIP